jgi:hypothetical protein
MPDELLRDETTQEGKETWAAVKKAADRAPEWFRNEVNTKHRQVSNDAEGQEQSLARPA